MRTASRQTLLLGQDLTRSTPLGTDSRIRGARMYQIDLGRAKIVPRFEETVRGQIQPRILSIFSLY